MITLFSNLGLMAQSAKNSEPNRRMDCIFHGGIR
jgi:hypothetical protein